MYFEKRKYQREKMLVKASENLCNGYVSWRSTTENRIVSLPLYNSH